MISTDITETLLRDLNYVGPAEASSEAPPGFSFRLDFESKIVWPDLPFDTSSPPSHYPPNERSIVLETLSTAESTFRLRAPKAWAFINAHLDSAMIRCSSAIDGASSSSNRELIGVCLLTNLHIPPERVSICLEALVHETIHQYLYRIELIDGNFCDLSDSGRYRSPWSGNRIPLHSIIHASFVWYGLLSMWCQLGETAAAADEALSLRTRIAPTLSGFAFLDEVFDSRAFPRQGVQPRIAELIRHMAQVATAVSRSAAGHPSVSAALRASEAGEWVPLLRAELARIGQSWH
jgi:hypothetical protein